MNFNTIFNKEVGEAALKKDILKAFNSPGAFSVYKSKRADYVVLVNGKRVTLNSGKSVYNGIGAAKCALRVQLDSLFWNARHNAMTFYSIAKDGENNYQLLTEKIKEIQDEWISKHVVYVPLSVYLVTAAKIKDVK